MFITGAYYELTSPYKGIEAGKYRLLYAGSSFLLLQKSRYHMIMVDLDITPHLQFDELKKEQHRQKRSLHLIYH